MATMNFQDEDDPKSQQPDSSSRDKNEPQMEDIFAHESAVGSKFLWVAIVVIVIAVIGGGLYFLNKHGYLNFASKHHTPPVVVMQSAPVPPPTSSVPPPGNVPTKLSSGKYALQVSAFKTKLSADNYAAKLKGKGIDAYVFQGNSGNDGKWFKVCVGSFDAKIRAIAAIENVKEKVGTDVWVVPAQ